MSEFAEVARPDELPGVLNHGRPSVVEAHQRHHAAFFNHSPNGYRLCWRPAHGLLAEDVLARPGRRAHDGQVAVIGSGHTHRRDPIILDQRGPVGGMAVEPVPGGPFPGPFAHGIGAADQAHLRVQFREAVSKLAVGPAVSVSHPPHADHAHTQ